MGETDREVGVLYDGATGLPNHDLFRDRLEVALKHAQRSRERLALLQIGIDAISSDAAEAQVAVHEAVLVEVARRLSFAVRAHDSVGRLGPRLFATLSVGDLTLETLQELAARLHVELAAPVSVDRDLYFVSASIGGSTCVPDMVSASALEAWAADALLAARAHPARLLIQDHDA